MRRSDIHVLYATAAVQLSGTMRQKPKITLEYAQAAIADLRARWLSGEMNGRDGFTEDGWPTVEFGVIPKDGRTSKNFDHFLHKCGTSWSKEVAKQGGPPPRQRQRLTFDEAMAYAGTEMVASASQWRAKAKIDHRLPQDPANFYEDHWQGWPHFLGTEKTIPTLEQILAACDTIHQLTGSWPNSQSEGELLPSWKTRTVDANIRTRLEGWPRVRRGKGLAGLLHEHRGVPIRVRDVPLTRETVTAAIAQHVKEFPGVSPMGREGLAPGLPIAFPGVNAALKEGRVHDVPKGTSIAQLCKEIGYAFRAFHVSREEAEAMCREFFAQHGRRLTVSDDDLGADGRLSGKTFDTLFRRGVVDGCDSATLAAFNDELGIPQITMRNIVTPETSLERRFPVLLAEWHSTKNDGLTPADVAAFSSKRVWWACSNCSHEWMAIIASRTGSGSGCPACNRGWTISVIREFVRSLAPHLSSLTPGELWVIFQQSGAFNATGRGKAFIKALATGRFPQDELNKFLAGAPSDVDEFFVGGVGADGPQVEPEVIEVPVADLADDVVAEIEEAADTAMLPTLTTSGILGALNAATSRASDPEAIEFLVASGKAKLWRNVFNDEVTAVAEARTFVGSGYADTVRNDFLREYEEARSLPIPKGYAFVPPGGSGITEPNLMQRLVASRIQREHRMGNWSGTGTGKTNAAILASRVVGAKLTVVCCPNSVVDGWADAIRAMFPDSTVVCKTFKPDWGRAKNHLYLVLNYELFQQPGARASVPVFAESQQIHFVVIDEIQFVKQRSDDAADASTRRKMVNAMLTLATEDNPDLYVLGLSATPAINNLREPVALVEMVTGKAHDDLATHPTVANCMHVYQRLTTIGPRWVMEHKTGCERREVAVDCSEYVDEIRRLGKHGTPLQLEEILTKARLPAILDALVPKTIVYTYYIGGVQPLDKALYEAIAAKGPTAATRWRVGFFTGEEKSGLKGFLGGDLDVLIASSAISTGVDRLQHVCNRLVLNVLPWTAAEFEQLIGRIHRQGQKRNVEVIIPLTSAAVNGQEWSWCKAKMQRLHFKKSVADAAVDGIVPEGHLRSQEKAYQDLMTWLERLSVGDVVAAERQPLAFTLPEAPDTLDRRRASFGDFSRMNARWNRAGSGTTHERLQRDPAEWRHYHDELARVRGGWPADPQDDFLQWAQRRTDLVIGDFGCGRAKVRSSIGDRHVVHSFDHVAVSEDVVACDMTHVPIEDEMLNVALFCLSMMGANASDYMREAYRTLRLDGWLHVYEPTARFSDRDGFIRSLRDFGFGNVEASDLGSFTHVSARKTEHQPHSGAELHGLG